MLLRPVVVHANATLPYICYFDRDSFFKRALLLSGGEFRGRSNHHPERPQCGATNGGYFVCPFNAPEEIKLDYQEAIRCRFVNAYNATIEMCGRSLESSCIQLGANPKLVLNDMIKWVHSQGKITTPLSEMAHKVKLGRNRAAHPNPSDRTLTSEDADAVLEFTREYFQHVYVMPAKMATFDFDKGKNKP